MLNKTKFLILSISFVLFFNSLTYGQCKDSACCNNNSLQKHSWSMQFGVGYNLSIYSFDDMMFSLKYHFSPKYALRFGVGYSGNTNDGSETVNGYTLNVKNIYQSFNSACIFMYYFNPKSKINIYLGAGPIASYSQYLYEYPHFENEYYYKNSEKRTEWKAGVQATLGAEWFPVRFISLFAEYIVDGEFQKSCINEYRFDSYLGIFNHHQSTSNQWLLEANNARMGLSLYF